MQEKEAKVGICALSAGDGKSGDSIWVDGSYDALLLGSADAAADRQAASLRREHNLFVAKSTATQLAGLEARDVILENVEQTRSINYIDFVVAFRRQPGEVGIIYTIGIQQRSKDASGEEAFSLVVKSFQRTKISN